MDNNEDVQKVAQDILDDLDRLYDLLYVQAKEIQDEYWARRWQANRDLPWKEKSIIGVRTRLRDNGSFNIVWFHDQWIPGHNGKMRPLSHHVRKGKSDRYSDFALLRKAQAWEADDVLGTEALMAPIRGTAKEIRATRRKLAAWFDKLIDEPEASDEDAKDTP